MELELVKMSPKGQLVVPQGIREKELFKPGDRFVSMAVKEGVLFKKMDLRQRFDTLAQEIREQFKTGRVTRKDVNEAVRWARKK